MTVSHPRLPQTPDIGESVAGEEDPGASLDMPLGDGVPAGTPGSGEKPCPNCAGTGQVGANPCPACDGTGKVIAGIGGG